MTMISFAALPRHLRAIAKSVDEETTAQHVPDQRAGLDDVPVIERRVAANDPSAAKLKELKRLITAANTAASGMTPPVGRPTGPKTNIEKLADILKTGDALEVARGLLNKEGLEIQQGRDAIDRGPYGQALQNAKAAAAQHGSKQRPWFGGERKAAYDTEKARLASVVAAAQGPYDKKVAEWQPSKNTYDRRSEALNAEIRQNQADKRREIDAIVGSRTAPLKRRSQALDASIAPLSSAQATLSKKRAQLVNNERYDVTHSYFWNEVYISQMHPALKYAELHNAWIDIAKALTSANSAVNAYSGDLRLQRVDASTHSFLNFQAVLAQAGIHDVRELFIESYGSSAVTLHEREARELRAVAKEKRAEAKAILNQKNSDGTPKTPTEMETLRADKLESDAEVAAQRAREKETAARQARKEWQEQVDTKRANLKNVVVGITRHAISMCDKGDEILHRNIADLKDAKGALDNEISAIESDTLKAARALLK